MSGFPCPLEAGNQGDGSPLTLGDPEAIGELFIASHAEVQVLDWQGEGCPELVVSGSGVCTYAMIAALPDGTPLVGRGQRWGRVSRVPHREEESDAGLCGQIRAVGDFDGDGRVE